MKIYKRTNDEELKLDIRTTKGLIFASLINKDGTLFKDLYFFKNLTLLYEALRQLSGENYYIKE